jgi:hypothetical protein
VITLLEVLTLIRDCDVIAAVIMPAVDVAIPATTIGIECCASDTLMATIKAATAATCETNMTLVPTLRNKTAHSLRLGQALIKDRLQQTYQITQLESLLSAGPNLQATAAIHDSGCTTIYWQSHTLRRVHLWSALQDRH